MSKIRCLCYTPERERWMVEAVQEGNKALSLVSWFFERSSSKKIRLSCVKGTHIVGYEKGAA